MRHLRCMEPDGPDAGAHLRSCLGRAGHDQHHLLPRPQRVHRRVESWRSVCRLVEAARTLSGDCRPSMTQEDDLTFIVVEADAPTCDFCGDQVNPHHTFYVRPSITPLKYAPA